jgi:hypothetical protein
LALRLKQRLTFPSGRMTLAVHIIERLTALETILVFIVSMAGTCAHERYADTLLTQTEEEDDEFAPRMYCIRNF